MPSAHVALKSATPAMITHALAYTILLGDAAIDGDVGPGLDAARQMLDVSQQRLDLSVTESLETAVREQTRESLLHAMRAVEVAGYL